MRRGLRAAAKGAGGVAAAALAACSGRAAPGDDGPAASVSAAVGRPAPASSTAVHPAPASSSTQAARFAAVRDAFVDEWLRDEPSAGRTLGLRESEGKVADDSREAIARRVARLRRAREEVSAVEPGALEPDEALDEPARLPQHYAELFAVDHYVKRDYAPLADRAERLVEHEEAALAQAPHVRANLAPTLSRPVAETAAQIYAGYADYLRRDGARAKLEPAFSLRGFHDELLAHGQPPVGLVCARVLAALERGR